MRASAAARFIEDITRRRSAYLAAALPHLPLAHATADPVLCSHLLFTWADQLDVEWHRAALAEVVRVRRARDARHRSFSAAWGRWMR